MRHPVGSSTHTTHTGNSQTSRLRSANNPHPCQCQQTHTNNRRGRNQQGQEKEDPRQKEIVEVKERQVMTQAFNQQRRGLFDIKGAFFSNTKVDRQGSNVLTFKDGANVLLCRVGNVLGKLSHGIIRSTRIPLFLTVKQIKYKTIMLDAMCKAGIPRKSPFHGP